MRLNNFKIILPVHQIKRNQKENVQICSVQENINEITSNKSETVFLKTMIVDFREHSMKDFARLNVYIADSNVIITQEMEDYSSTQLVSDIGGQLGLWVGISIITLAEVSNKP